ncbi:MAG: dTDP-4-dehydrorhamnose 3,5-epimerase [Bacteroidota bacterium]
MTTTETHLPGLLLFEPRVFEDARGAFRECYHADRYRAHGLDADFVQDNLSRSKRGVLRGLHFQKRYPQGKLLWVVRGTIFDVAVDLRPGPTFGQHVAVELSEANGRQLWVPPGFAHGFCALSDQADVFYKCTDLYRPDDEGGLRWDDPAFGIDWPIAEPILSDRDRQHPTLAELEPEDLPHVEGVLTGAP